MIAILNVIMPNLAICLLLCWMSVC